ncbi:OmpW family protein [Novosphingobium sp. FSW06-99]|uniref:OmpW/AlkL family protein n=1 Tax=Novosphingobium sp. FSW06-99 TaxID=1739113 RepID=UPI0018D2389D|nr:OmpW family outer membrane protein [Novosphingobium sp. FSW06-99]
MRQIRRMIAPALCLSGAAPGVPAMADPLPAHASGPVPTEPDAASGVTLEFGPGNLSFSAGATVREAGTVVPGGTVAIAADTTLIVELGYRWRNLGISLTGGVPPLARVQAAGTLAPLGTLGQIRYGPVVASAHYHLSGLGRFRPYIGGGPALLLVFANHDDAVTRLNVHDHFGVVGQIGAEYRISRHFALTIDAKKAALRTNATANLGPVPIGAAVRLDPLVVAAGASYHF